MRVTKTYIEKLKSFLNFRMIISSQVYLSLFGFSVFAFTSDGTLAKLFPNNINMYNKNEKL